MLRHMSVLITTSFQPVRNIDDKYPIKSVQLSPAALMSSCDKMHDCAVIKLIIATVLLGNHL